MTNFAQAARHLCEKNDKTTYVNILPRSDEADTYLSSQLAATTNLPDFIGRELRDFNDTAVSHSLVTLVNGRFRILSAVAYLEDETHGPHGVFNVSERMATITPVMVPAAELTKQVVTLVRKRRSPVFRNHSQVPHAPPRISFAHQPRPSWRYGVHSSPD